VNLVYGYGNNTVCVKAVDNFYGNYTITGGGYIFFDGLGNSRYVNGVAIVKNAQNEIVKVYSYEIDKNGNPLMVQVTNDSVVVEYLFIETADGDYVSSDSKKYSIIQVDELYLAKATDSTGAIYLFDGIGSVTVDGVTMSYTIIEKDSAKKTITIEINDGTTTKTAVINYVITTNVTITFVDNTL
jgi:hydrogenase maturation factor HypF (carbamoyltransferase family)